MPGGFAEGAPSPLGASRSVAAEGVAAEGVATNFSSWNDPGWGQMPGEVSPSGQEQADEEQLVDLVVWIRESPPWLASAVLHMLALILLGLLFGGVAFDRPIELEASYAEEIGDQLFEEQLILDAQLDIEVEQALSPSVLPEAETPLALPQLAAITPTGNLFASTTPTTNIGVALRGRTESLKQVLLKTYGGTASTERAVWEGLKWLEKNQRRDGMWSLLGPYRDGARIENEQAATAMALLAFQGAGYTHQMSSEKPFARTVTKGWRALLSKQQDNGALFGPNNYNHAIYTHAQATIALCELLAMTDDASLRLPAQRAVDYLVKVQSSGGGWRYVPGEGGDLSVTGWAVMALQSARIAGLVVPSKTFHDVERFINSCQSDGGARYGYTPRDGARLSMTAEGLLCRQYMGWKQDDPRLKRGAYYLLDNLPSWKRGQRNVYYWYYATQVLHHLEGDYWTRWNNVMRELLPRQQEKQGREKGSWDPSADEAHGRSGGRLYTTCLSIYILEVYYRHLPIYKQELIGGL